MVHASKKLSPGTSATRLYWGAAAGAGAANDCAANEVTDSAATKFLVESMLMENLGWLARFKVARGTEYFEVDRAIVS